MHRVIIIMEKPTSKLIRLSIWCESICLLYNPPRWAKRSILLFYYRLFTRQNNNNLVYKLSCEPETVLCFIFIAHKNFHVRQPPKNDRLIWAHYIILHTTHKLYEPKGDGVRTLCSCFIISSWYKILCSGAFIVPTKHQ